jgi:hypothetical protein
MQYDWTGSDYRRRMVVRLGFVVAAATVLAAAALLQLM